MANMVSSDRNIAQKSHYCPDVDGLRAVAVCLVIIFHLDESWLPGGFTGVDIFFVISGFVVYRSILSRWPILNGGGISSFYKRRILRILPPLALTISIVSILTTMLIPPVESVSMLPYALSAIVGGVNLHFLSNVSDYFGPTLSLNPFTHLWSLGVEEQFYFVFPFLLLIESIINKKKDSSFNIVKWCCIGSMICSFYLSYNFNYAGFYLMPSRFWELGCGALLAGFCTNSDRFKVSNLVASILYIFGFIGIVVGTVYSPNSTFPMPTAIATVLGTCLVIAAGRCVIDPYTIPLSSPVLVGIGRRSYELYLWHWPIFTLLRWTIGMDDSAVKTLAICLTFFVAFGAYKFVFEFMGRFERYLLIRYRSFKFGGGVICALVCSLLVIMHSPERVFQFNQPFELARSWNYVCHKDGYESDHLKQCLDFEGGGVEEKKLFL